MSAPTIPYFTDINFNKLDEYYDVEIEFEGREVDIDLNFDSDKIDQAVIDKIGNFLNKLPQLHAACQQYIQKDYEEGGTVKEYLQHHLQELDEDELEDLLDGQDNEMPKEEQMLTALHLVRVGLYPDNEEEDQFATFDFSISRDLTDYLIVVDVKEDGSLHYITMES